MKKLVIHVGFPKCASTSFQRSLMANSDIQYPLIGLHDSEHLAVPLKIKGIDAWTGQWFDSQWVDQNFDELVKKIDQNEGLSIISSERLAELNEDQMDKLLSYFPNHEVEFVVIIRDKESYIKSNWRHAVFRHNLSSPFNEFKESMKYMDMHVFYSKFGDSHKVSSFNMDDDGWETQLEKYLGHKLVIEKENVSADFKCCEFLSAIHRHVGTESFSNFFSHDVKNEFSNLFLNQDANAIEAFEVPMFGNIQKTLLDANM